MSQLADIDRAFAKALSKGVGDEEELMALQLEVLEAIEWDDAADEVAAVMVSKGYEVPSYYNE